MKEAEMFQVLEDTPIYDGVVVDVDFQPAVLERGHYSLERFLERHPRGGVREGRRKRQKERRR